MLSLLLYEQKLLELIQISITAIAIVALLIGKESLKDLLLKMLPSERELSEASITAIIWVNRTTEMISVKYYWLECWIYVS